MTEPIRDEDAVLKHRAEEAKQATEEAKQVAGEPVEPPVAEARPCHVPVRPGFGQAAYKAGCEDEWIDRMSARYGGDW